MINKPVVDVFIRLLHTGSNHRLESLFHKLNSGLPITVSVVGGSNSAGHGLGHEGFPSELDSMGNMHYRVFDWIRARWPNEGHRFVNGAIPGASESSCLRADGAWLSWGHVASDGTVRVLCHGADSRGFRLGPRRVR